ncbi:hypothetical protein M513_00684 [Trichuris suis]|nr:hypothetical protein M513_00684 [Trichuris suis]
MRFFLLFNPVVALLIRVSAFQVELPIADQGVTGWIQLKPSTSGLVAVTVSLAGVPARANVANVTFHNIPFAYGGHDCSALAETPYLNPNSSFQLPVVDDQISGEVEIDDSILNKIFSVLITFEHSEVSVCATSTAQSRIYISRFYGSQVAGSVFFFVSNGMMTILSNLINGENTDSLISWSIRKKWWQLERNAHEPTLHSCRNSAEKAPVWYSSHNPNDYLQPDMTTQIISVGSMSEKHLSNLDMGVLVLQRVEGDVWQSSTLLGCARIARVPSYDFGNVAATFPNSSAIFFEQASPFHPLIISSGEPALTDLAVIVPNQRNQSQCEEFDPSVNLNVLKSTNLLPSKHKSGSPFSVVATDATLYGENSILKHLLIVGKSSINSRCAPIESDNLIAAAAKFFYPAVGEVYFYQDQRSWESVTFIIPKIRHLFDLTVPEKAEWMITDRRVGWSQEEMACSTDTDVFDPFRTPIQYCRRAAETCPIGSLTEKFGHLFTGSHNELTGLGIYATTTIPLSGPHSVIGNTLRLGLGFADSCANIEIEKLRADHGNELWPEFKNASAPVFLSATFDGTILRGTVEMAQVAEDGKVAFSMQPGMIFYKVLSAEEDEPFEVSVLESDNETECDRATSVYNPFYLPTDAENYTALCQSSAPSCAIGDISGQAGAAILTGTDGSLKVPYLPLQGPYSMAKKVLRLRSKENHKRVACATLEEVELRVANITAAKSLSESEIRSIFKETFHLENHELFLRQRDAGIEFVNCLHYSILIAGRKDNNELKQFFSSNRWVNFNALRKSLRLGDCIVASGAASSGTLQLTATAAFVAAIVIKYGY